MVKPMSLLLLLLMFVQLLATALADTSPTPCPKLSKSTQALYFSVREDPTCDVKPRPSKCYRHCRFCWTQKTDKNKAYPSCASLEAAPQPTTPSSTSVPPTVEPTFAPLGMTDEPPTNEPAFSTFAGPDDDKPTDLGPADAPDGSQTDAASGSDESLGGAIDCKELVSQSERANGISASNDLKCYSDDANCFNTKCRRCQAFKTQASISLKPCDGDELAGATPAPAANLPIGPATLEPMTELPLRHRSTEVPTQEPTTNAPSPPASSQGPALSMTKIPMTETPPVTLSESPTTEDSPQAPTQWIPTGECADTILPQDKAVSISGVSDIACAIGGLGCFSDTCRFCKLKDTVESEYLIPCSDFAPSIETPIPTTTAAPVPTPTPAPTPWVPTGECADAVSPGDQSVGISGVSDNGCFSDGLGCFLGTCRYCKLRDTPQAGHLYPCSRYAPQ